MAEVVEDGQRSPPGLPSGGEAAEGEVNVAEAHQAAGFAGAVSEFPVQEHRLLVVGDRLVILAKAPIGSGDAVKRVRLAELVVYLPLQVEGLPAIGQPCLVVALLDVEPAQRVQGASLPGSVTRGPEQVECLLRVVERFRVAALPIEHQREAPVCLRFTGMIAESAVQLKRAQKAGMCLGVPTRGGISIGEAAVAYRPRMRVAQAVGRTEGKSMGGNGIVIVTAAIEE